MPAKKKLKAKVVKKLPAKKAVAKKLPAKKIVKKALVKKAPLKKVQAKKVAPKKLPKKSAAKVKKVVKKITKPVKKLVKKAVKKIETKKVAKAKKPIVKAPKKAEKIVKKVEKAVKAPAKTKKGKKAEIIVKQAPGLAKTLMLARGNEKKVEAPKALEKKNDAPQKIILAKKSEGRAKVIFKIGDYAVYPSHGIGKIADIEKTSVLGQDFSCYLMYFEKEKLKIKIPMNSAEKIGLRHLIRKSQMDEVFGILRSGVKKLKGMWSRRAQEYETKINSGDIMLLAEVLRDLTRDIEDGERSYSERIIYETAIYRLASEYSAIYGIEFEEAKDKVTLTAKDKLNSEGKVTQKDEFDEFDLDGESADIDEDEEELDEEGDEDEDDDYDDEDDDDKPKKRRKK
jgi:CarD family transcriptional regulator